MKTLNNKIVLITGGARGIGKSIALDLAEAGANIVFTDIASEADMNNTAQEIKALGVDARGIFSNAASFTEAHQVVEQVLNHFNRLDILVNNAGITRDGLLMRMSEADWDLVITVNLKSVFNYTKAAIRPMMSQRSGKIINISSVVGVMGNAGQANYSASKAGIIGFTKSVAKELASRNIQVNAIAPGYVETAMTAKLTDDQRKLLIDAIPLKRTAQPKDIAAIVKFLSSPDSDYITGQVINVSGGLYM